MALKDVTYAVNTVFSSIFDSLVSNKQFRYAKQLSIGLVFMVLLAGAWMGQRWFNAHKEESAYQLFAQNVEEFQRTMQEGRAQDWASVETLFKLGYDQYAGTTVAPYFLVYQAEAMERQGKSLDEVKGVLQRAIKEIPAHSPVLAHYQVKLALIQLDMTQEQEQKAGLESLRALAQDTKSIAHDTAAYYLGLYQMTHNETAQAQDTWKKLAESQKDVQKLGQSSWAHLAQQRLEQLA